MRPSPSAHTLLAAGASAGPLFVLVAAVQILAREGFDLRRHPLSLLSLGDLGWIQVSNFVLSGVLSIALAVGMRRVLAGQRGGTWGPALMGVYGAGLVLGGVARPDPALGFPPGTPDAMPATMSAHGVVHAIAPPLAFVALTAACLVLARRFAASGRRGWAGYSIATAVLAFGLAAWPSMEGVSIRLAIAVTVGFAWTTALALELRRA